MLKARQRHLWSRIHSPGLYSALKNESQKSHSDQPLAQALSRTHMERGQLNPAEKEGNRTRQGHSRVLVSLPGQSQRRTRPRNSSAAQCGPTVALLGSVLPSLLQALIYSVHMFTLKGK